MTNDFLKDLNRPIWIEIEYADEGAALSRRESCGTSATSDSEDQILEFRQAPLDVTETLPRAA